MMEYDNPHRRSEGSRSSSGGSPERSYLRAESSAHYDPRCYPSSEHSHQSRHSRHSQHSQNSHHSHQTHQSHHSYQSRHSYHNHNHNQYNGGRSNNRMLPDLPLARGPSPGGRPCRPYKASGEHRIGVGTTPHQQAAGLDVGGQKMSLRHIIIPSMNVIIASMPNSPVAALQYLQCFLETAKKLREEEKAKEIYRQLEFVKTYLRKSQQQSAFSK